MSVEGMLGKHVLNGERAATDDHPAVLHHLPLSETAKANEIPIGTVMKRVDVTVSEGQGESATTKVTGAAWEPYLSTDAASVKPVAVVDDACDAGDSSALCLVHGGVKLRMLKTGDGKELSDIQIALLSEQGIYAV